MKIGIIGHGTDKFTEKGQQRAIDKIIYILSESMIVNNNQVTFISGHSPVGGIDIWAEKYAKIYNIPTDIKIPKQHKWDGEYGYKQRNLDIAKCSDELHIILVDTYPPNYKGMKFDLCYHCKSTDHIKSGACWTGNQAKKLGKRVIVHIIKNEGE